MRQSLKKLQKSRHLLVARVDSLTYAIARREASADPGSIGERLSALKQRDALEELVDQYDAEIAALESTMEPPQHGFEAVRAATGRQPSEEHRQRQAKYAARHRARARQKRRPEARNVYTALVEALVDLVEDKRTEHVHMGRLKRLDAFWFVDIKIRASLALADQGFDHDQAWEKIDGVIAARRKERRDIDIVIDSRRENSGGSQVDPDDVDEATDVDLP